MNIELLELAESALGELVDKVVFVGGATVGLWITDPAAPPVRPTDDVDVVVEVTTRSEFHSFEENSAALASMKTRRAASSAAGAIPKLA